MWPKNTKKKKKKFVASVFWFWLSSQHKKKSSLPKSFDFNWAVNTFIHLLNRIVQLAGIWRLTIYICLHVYNTCLYECFDLCVWVCVFVLNVISALRLCCGPISCILKQFNDNNDLIFSLYLVFPFFPSLCFFLIFSWCSTWIEMRQYVEWCDFDDAARCWELLLTAAGLDFLHSSKLN